MPDLKYLPISCSDPVPLYSLMEEEEKAWMNELGWDYSPVRKILTSFIEQNLLPGYVAVQRNKAVGYIYFLMNPSKGIIGAIYVKETEDFHEITEKLLSLTISSLKDSPKIRRVEAQIMPFNDIDCIEILTRNSFRYFPRHYLSFDFNPQVQPSPITPKHKVIPWDSHYLIIISELLLKSYFNQTDAVICADYRTTSGCEGYLRSILENPGCGVFMPEVSFIGLDERDHPCGFIIGCRLSDGVGMIPQIAVHPSYQGKKLGNALMNRSLLEFGKLGFHRVTLTVTSENRRAFEWYVRLGFKVRKNFGAFVWER